MLILESKNWPESKGTTIFHNHPMFPKLGTRIIIAIKSFPQGLFRDLIPEGKITGCLVSTPIMSIGKQPYAPWSGVSDFLETCDSGEVSQKLKIS